MQSAKIISNTFQNTQEKIKAELYGFKNSFSKIGDSDFRFKIKDIYINWGYRLISLIDPPPLPKKGERIESWLKRIKPMQAYRVCKARILNSKNWMDYLDSIGIDRLIDFERFKRQKEYAKYQKQLNEAEKWMRRAIERMERH